MNEERTEKCYFLVRTRPDKLLVVLIYVMRSMFTTKYIDVPIFYDKMCPIDMLTKFKKAATAILKTEKALFVKSF